MLKISYLSGGEGDQVDCRLEGNELQSSKKEVVNLMASIAKE